MEIFKLVHERSLTSLAFHEREYLDSLTYTNRRCFLELGRRMRERELIEDPIDVWFLGLEEAFALLDGRDHKIPLAHAKIEARKRNFYRFLAKEVNLPNYLRPEATPPGPRPARRWYVPYVSTSLHSPAYCGPSSFGPTSPTQECAYARSRITLASRWVSTGSWVARSKTLR